MYIRVLRRYPFACITYEDEIVNILVKETVSHNISRSRRESQMKLWKFLLFSFTMYIVRFKGTRVLTTGKQLQQNPQKFTITQELWYGNKKWKLHFLFIYGFACNIRTGKNASKILNNWTLQTGTTLLSKKNTGNGVHLLSESINQRKNWIWSKI